MESGSASESASPPRRRTQAVLDLREKPPPAPWRIVWVRSSAVTGLVMAGGLGEISGPGEQNLNHGLKIPGSGNLLKM